VNVHTTEPISPRLLANIKSAVEQYATFGTANSTVGSLIEVTPQMIYASGLLIVKFRFGEAEIAHAESINNIFLLRNIDTYLDRLYGLAKTFVLEIIHMHEKIPAPDFVVALWENGIGIGGNW